MSPFRALKNGKLIDGSVGLANEEDLGMPVIAVIDYDAGNLHSACKGIEAAGGQAHVTDSATELDRADAILLPGEIGRAHV